MDILEKLTQANATILIDIYKDQLGERPITGWQVAEFYCDNEIISENELKTFTDITSKYIFANINNKWKRLRSIDKLFRIQAQKYGWGEDTQELIVEQQISKNVKEFK
jgi:hypothetical protein